MNEIHTFPNRTLCDVLREMRQADKTKNYSYMRGLIEEAQSLGNRMESALNDKSDIKEWNEKRTELKSEIKSLEQKRKELKKETYSVKLNDEQWDKVMKLLENPPKPGTTLVSLTKESKSGSED